MTRAQNALSAAAEKVNKEKRAIKAELIVLLNDAKKNAEDLSLDNQLGAWYLILCAVPGLVLFLTGIALFVCRVRYWVNPRLEVSRYLDEITDYDACKIRWHAEKLIPVDESIEDVLALTDFYVDG